jgi:hypothetical protein
MGNANTSMPPAGVQRDLFGDPIRPKVRRAPRPKKTARHQYRRRAWEDFVGVQLAAGDLFDPAADPIGPTQKAVEVPVAVIQDRDADLDALLAAVRESRAAVYRRRWELRIAVHREDDHKAKVDYVDALLKLARDIHAEGLAERGLRSAAAGVYPVSAKKPEGRWRVRMWNPDRGVNEHRAYFATEAEAREYATQWWQKQRKLNTQANIPEWIRECLKDANHVQGDECEAAHAGAGDDEE